MSMRDGEMVPLAHVASIAPALRAKLTSPAPEEVMSQARGGGDGEEETKPDYKHLFYRPKSEVYGLLKMDNYKRWKEMPSFTEYITSARPYASQSNSMGDVSTNILSDV